MSTALRAIVNGSWLAEASIIGEFGSLSAASISGAPSTEVMIMVLRLSCLAARFEPSVCGSLMAKIASTLGKRVSRLFITVRPASRWPLPS